MQGHDTLHNEWGTRGLHNRQRQGTESGRNCSKSGMFAGV